MSIDVIGENYVTYPTSDLMTRNTQIDIGYRNITVIGALFIILWLALFFKGLNDET